MYLIYVTVFLAVEVSLCDHADEKRLLLNDPSAFLDRLTELEGIVKQQAITIKQLQTDSKNKVGSTYIRWGRKQCPSNNTTLVYSGFAGGGNFDQTGSAAKYVCLTPNPKFNRSGGPDYGRIYGAEFESNWWASDSADKDVPCALCKTPYATTVMIPGTNECSSGWRREYHGYLASGYYGHKAASSYACVDVTPEYLNKGTANENGVLFHTVVAKCGTLPCPPYFNNYPVTCVVCSS